MCVCFAGQVEHVVSLTVVLHSYRCKMQIQLLWWFKSSFVFHLFVLQDLTEEVVGSPIPEPRLRSRLFRSHSESSDELSELDLSHGKKDAFVLEVCINTNPV